MFSCMRDCDNPSSLQVSMSTIVLKIFCSLSLVQLPKWRATGPLGEELENYYVCLQWCRLLPGGWASSVNGFGDWELAQTWKLGKTLWIFMSTISLSQLVNHPSFLLMVQTAVLCWLPSEAHLQQWGPCGRGRVPAPKHQKTRGKGSLGWGGAVITMSRRGVGGGGAAIQAWAAELWWLLEYGIPGRV